MEFVVTISASAPFEATSIKELKHTLQPLKDLLYDLAPWGESQVITIEKV
jgi:hypothetical protein